MRNKIVLLILLAFPSVFPAAIPGRISAADIIVRYDFTGTGAAQLVASAHDGNVQWGLISFGAGASQSAATNELHLSVAPGATNAATAVSTNSYFEFSVAPVPGFEIDLDSLSFDGTSVNSLTDGFAIRSSIDSYTNNLLSGNYTTNSPTFASYSVSLTGSSFQNLTSSTTFRIYGFIGTLTTPYVVFDNLLLSGTVVPEPSTWMMAGSALAILVAARLRQTRGRKTSEVFHRLR